MGTKGCSQGCLKPFDTNKAEFMFLALQINLQTDSGKSEKAVLKSKLKLFFKSWFFLERKALSDFGFICNIELSMCRTESQY